MKPIKTLIIDDQEDAIQNLLKLLEKYPEINVAGTASNVESALCMIISNSPDLIFLDVEMPGKNGFELIAELSESDVELPQVVFTTAV